MSAPIDVVDVLEHLSRQAVEAGKKYEADALNRGARLLSGALARAAAQETMRDRAAFAALTGLLAGNPERDTEDAVREAYQAADQVLRVREK